MRKLYNIYKKIIRLELSEISGSDYDKFKKETEIFVTAMIKYIEKKK